MTASSSTGPIHRPVRVRLVRAFCFTVVRALFRLRVEGRQHFARGPAIYCFNHLNWADPIVLLAVLPIAPRYAMLGPREVDMTKGTRNRLMTWAGFGIPYQPSGSDMIAATRRVTRALGDGWVVVIAGEGRIHRGEHELLPLAGGPAFFALRAGVPIIPIALNGTSWLGFRRRVRVRVGEPLHGDGRPAKGAVEALTEQTAAALRALVADFPEPAAPGPFGRWLTELFNDWPEGARPALGDGDAARGASPAMDGAEAAGDPG